MNKKNNELTMHIEPSVVEELADKLYDNKQALIAEIIANAYDADATKVFIQWNNEKIVLMDNGHGMTRKEINDSFLVIGKRKEDSKRVTRNFQRISFGSKGIGKLASIALANKVNITSWISEEIYTSFELDSKKMYSTTGGEYKPKENTGPFTTPTKSGTIISMTEIKDNQTISLKDMARKIVNIFSVVLKEEGFDVFLDCGFTNEYKEIIIDDIRLENLDNIISFEEKINLPLKFKLSEKDLKAELDYSDITSSTTISEIVENEVKNQGESTLKNMLERELIVQNAKDFEKKVFPSKKVKICGWIGTVNSQKKTREIEVTDKKIIVPIIYDGNVNVVVNKRIGQADLKKSLPNLSSRFYRDYVVGSIHVDFFDETNFKGMARSDRQGYTNTDERFRYLQDITTYLINKLVKSKDETKEKRKKGFKETIIKKTNNTKRKLMDNLVNVGASVETQKLAIAALAENSGYRTTNKDKMVFISFRDNESEFPNWVYEACLEINNLMSAKNRFEIFYANSEDTSTYKLYEKLKKKLSNREIYENIFSFVILSPYYVNNWYTDIEFGMIHQSMETNNYGFITKDKKEVPLDRTSTDGGKCPSHKQYNDYDLLSWPADGSSLSEILSVFEEMIISLEIKSDITKGQLEEIIKRNFNC